MSRASDLCGNYDFCPSGDCDICGLQESEEMSKAQFLDDLEELLNKELFKGTEEQKKRIIQKKRSNSSNQRYQKKRAEARRSCSIYLLSVGSAHKHRNRNKDI